MPRPKRQPAVVPTTSLVASATQYRGSAARIYKGSKEWQRECYRHYSICGEARFAAQFYGHALSRTTLGIATLSPHGREVQTSGPAVDYLAALFNGKEGQAQMLTALGVHLTIAGEAFLVGRQVETLAADETGGEVVTGTEDVWEIISVLEMRNQGKRWWIKVEGAQDIELNDQDTVTRIWRPHPENRMEADSPFRSLLPILVEVEWLTRHVFAQVQSRLAGAGILFLPQGMSFPPPPEIDGVPQVVANDADAFLRTLADAMITPLDDPGSPAALMPVTVTAPDDVIDKAHLMHFWSELDAHAKEMRQEAIHRFALGMDLPVEQITGMSGHGTGGGRSNGVSHWGAWQIEEATVKMHIEPMLELIANAITMGYLRPLGVTDQFVYYDTSALRLRPDRSQEAITLYNLGILSAEVLLRENGFDVTDMPQEAEFHQWLLRKVATGSATPEQMQGALAALGVDLPGQPVGDATDMRETRPDPSIQDLPTRGMPDRNAAQVDPALLAAGTALVFRALERAGNRIRQTAGVKPPNVRAYDMHTLHQVNGSADIFLNDAWSCAPEVLSGIADCDSTVQVLDSYVRSLFANKEPHTRERLKEWLEATA